MLLNSSIFYSGKTLITFLSLIEVVGVLPVELVLVTDSQAVHVRVHGARVELAACAVTSGGSVDLLAHVGRLAVELVDDVAVGIDFVLLAGGALVHVVTGDHTHGAHEDQASDEGGGAGDVLRQLLEREGDVSSGRVLSARYGVSERLGPRLGGGHPVPRVVGEGAGRDQGAAEGGNTVVAGGDDGDTGEHLGVFFVFLKINEFL